MKEVLVIEIGKHMKVLTRASIAIRMRASVSFLHHLIRFYAIETVMRLD